MPWKRGTCLENVEHASKTWNMPRKRGTCLENVEHASKTWNMPWKRGTSLENVEHASKTWNKPRKTRKSVYSRLLLINKECASHFRRETADKDEQKLWYEIHAWSKLAFKGTVIIYALSFAWRVTWNYTNVIKLMNYDDIKLTYSGFLNNI